MMVEFTIGHLWDVIDNFNPWTPTSQLIGLKGSAHNVLLPYTTAHLASIGQSCSGGT